LKIIDTNVSGKNGDDKVIEEVTSAINGAKNGIEQRKKATQKAKEITNDKI
jgi:predicted chitinase